MKTSTIFLLTVLAFNYAHAQFAIEWENTIGGNSTDILNALQQTTDGGYIAGGYSTSDISGDKTEGNIGSSDYWIVKLDSNGNPEWQNTIGGIGGDLLVAIRQTNDGGYIAGGYSNSGISGDKTEANRGGHDYWVVKLDAAGNIQWQKTLGGASTDFIADIQQTVDRGYILGGHSTSGISGDKTENGIGNSDYWIIKLDSLGNVQWQNTIGGSLQDLLSIIIQTTDGGYLAGGFSFSGISGDKTENSLGEDYWIVKLDNSGNIQWQNTIGGSANDKLTTALQTSDGGYFLGGYSFSTISGDKTDTIRGSNDYWVLKLDATGIIQWQKTLGGDANDYLQDLKQTSDGGYILGGSSFSSISGEKTHTRKGSQDYWIIKLDGAGNIQWQNTIGGRTQNELTAIQQTADGAYLAAGYSGFSFGSSIASCDKSENGAAIDYWIVKLPATPELPEISINPDTVNRGNSYQIEFSAGNFIFSQADTLYLENSGTTVFPDSVVYPDDTTAIASFSMPLFPCGNYDVHADCFVFNEALTLRCQPFDIHVTPSTASRCSQLQINFTSENFDFVQGSPIYFHNGFHQINADSFVTLSDTTAVGFFTISQNDPCGFYALRHYAVDSFPNKFEILCTPPQCAKISGYLFIDTNANCIKDTSDIPIRNGLVELATGAFRYYATSDSNGFYSATVGYGNFDIRAVPRNNLWTTPPCTTPIQTVTVSSTNDSVTVNLPVIVNNNCPFLEVDIGVGSLRHCQGALYTIQYCNLGVVSAPDASIEVEMDSFVTVISSTIPWRLPQSGRRYIFDLGDIGAQECGTFSLNVTVSCLTLIGQTICASAHAFPDSICSPPDTLWDGSSVAVEAGCANDTVQFRISNTGTGNMQDSLYYYIVEDNVMLRSNKFKLLSGQRVQTFELANGSTFRLEAQQSPGHPGRSQPSVSVEGCRISSTGNFSLGFVTTLPQDEANPFIAISCDEVVAPLDPNDKISFPKGIGAEKLISATTELDYKIRFQNIGTDTAHNVWIRDTLSPYLDITTFELGAASHPFSFRIYGTGILEWTFDNILLPDSFVNEPESHGFVQFRIAQVPGNPEGTVIENSADIYFDFNAPIKTNVEFNTVGDINKVLLSVFENFDLQNNILVFPNPFSDFLTVEIDGKPMSNIQFEVYDVLGRLIRNYAFENTNQLAINNISLNKGMYFYRIIADGAVIGDGKLVGVE